MTPRQPLTLLYQAYDGLTPISREGRIVAAYEDGLGGKTDSPFRETAPISFTQYVPAILAGENGAALAVQTTVANANAIVQRAPDGTWSAMSTGMTGGSADVWVIARGLDGTIYAGGGFTDAGGSGADYFAKWNPSTGAWSVVKSATSINGFVTSIVCGPDGKIYLGGYFTNADGIANADYIAVYDPGTNTYAALGTGGDAAVNALVFDASGNLYAGGLFTVMGGVGATAYIAKWNGSVWAPLGTGMGGSVSTLVIGADGSLYAGGLFTTAGGGSAARVAKWNGAAWSALGAGLNAECKSLVVGLDGLLYAGGSFTTAGGLSIAYFARWNGAGWQAPPGGVLDNYILHMYRAADGSIYMGGAFLTAGGVSLPDSLAKWNGSSFVAVDINLPGTAISEGVFALPDGRLYIGFDQTGSATAAGITTVTNNGTARTYPIVSVTGPSSGSARLYGITNTTTGKLLYLNVTIASGETLTFRTAPQGTTLTSSARGEITAGILPGSAQDLALEPGSNTISFFASASSVTATMRWPVAYQSPSDLVYK